jgi:DNA-directed RNA polymerase specialized sigma24 family protein
VDERPLMLPGDEPPNRDFRIRSKGNLLRCRSDVIRAFGRCRDLDEPRSGSIVHRISSTGGDRSGDPFHPWLLAGLEERAELADRLRRVGPRERRLLFLWYAEGQPVSAIAKTLGISRVHCYRLRDRAIQAMLADAT